jgi:hypothetical protein
MATERAENVLKKQIADSDLHFYFHPVLPLRVSFNNFIEKRRKAQVIGKGFL